MTALLLQNGHQSVNEMKSLVHSAADSKRMQMGLAERLTGGKRLQGRQAKAVAAGEIPLTIAQVTLRGFDMELAQNSRSRNSENSLSTFCTGYCVGASLLVAPQLKPSHRDLGQRQRQQRQQRQRKQQQCCEPDALAQNPVGGGQIYLHPQEAGATIFACSCEALLFGRRRRHNAASPWRARRRGPSQHVRTGTTTAATTRTPPARSSSPPPHAMSFSARRRAAHVSSGQWRGGPRTLSSCCGSIALWHWSRRSEQPALARRPVSGGGARDAALWPPRHARGCVGESEMVGGKASPLGRGSPL